MKEVIKGTAAETATESESTIFQRYSS